MGKLKDLWNGDNGGFFKFATVITVVFLAKVLFFGQNSLVRWTKAGLELKGQRKQIERYQEEIRSMDKQIEMLSNDRDSLEEFARENFLFAAPGDDVFIVEE